MIRTKLKDDGYAFVDGVDIQYKTRKSGLINEHLKIDYCYNYTLYNIVQMLENAGIKPITIDSMGSDHICILGKASTRHSMSEAWYKNLENHQTKCIRPGNKRPCPMA